MKSIKALNYVPNYSARSLIRRSNNSIGIIHMSRGARNTDHRYEWSYSSDSFTHDVEEGVFQAIAQQDLDTTPPPTRTTRTSASGKNSQNGTDPVG